ncbi:MAG TPA: M23 family metallopeptidase [Xanthobacteraceae bacterium]|nr:M23 family metallopeptidase [Xanthobacteraceae bacterium]
MAETYFGRHYGRRPHPAPHPVPRPPALPSRNTLAVIATIALLGLWAAGATLYVIFHDDALMLLAEHQAAMARSHGAEVRELMTEVERLRSVKMIDQERVERALAELLKRQAKLEERENVLGSIATRRDPAPEVTATVPRSPEPMAPMKPTPLSDTILIAPPLERTARLESRPAAPFRLRLAGADNDVTRQVVALGREVEAFDMRQAERLNALEEELDERATRVRHVLADLALPTPAAKPMKVAAMGGPFLPYFGKSEDPFERQLARVHAAAASEAELTRALDRVPVKRPLRDAEVTSPFGVRLDPFLRQWALHAGVDFRGESGGPVRATAAGRVVAAGPNGGYGLAIDIDHGGGIVTRYGHLSAVLVAEGSEIKAGDVIGKIGTTGRSTGPHLHYEVRVNGEAVDPQRFLRAGLRLDTAL